MKAVEGNSPQVPEVENKAELSEAEIDASLADTCPASDPPAWTLGWTRRAVMVPARRHD